MRDGITLTVAECDELNALAAPGSLHALLGQLRQAKELALNGSIGLELEISYGSAKDAWVTARLRPRKNTP